MDEREILKIHKSEIAHAAMILHLAFEDDPLMLWLFGDKSTYWAEGRALMESSVCYAVKYGFAYRTSNFEAVVIGRKPKDVLFSHWRLWRAGMSQLPSQVSKEVFDRIMVLEDVLAGLKQKKLPGTPFLFCWMIGVNPVYQGKGFGGALMKQVSLDAQRLGVPSYLEVAEDHSMQFHAHQGYEKLADVMLPNSQVKVSVMLRK